MEQLSVSNETRNEITKASESDLEYQELRNTILKGWPRNKKELNPAIQQFFHYQAEMTVQEGIIFRDRRILIPLQLRKSILDKLHLGHMGITGTIRRARELVFWPGITSDIKTMIQECSTCNMYQHKSQMKEPLIPNMPERPWQIIGADLFYFDGEHYLVIVDHFSNFIEMCKLN